MINYCFEDDYISEILLINETVNFNNVLPFKHQYYIYGMIAKDRPPIRIDTSWHTGRGRIIVNPSRRKMQNIRAWLEDNGLNMFHGSDNESDIKIGLRRDIRKNVKFSAALIRTIIAYFEGWLKLDKDFKIPVFLKDVSYLNALPEIPSQRETEAAHPSLSTTSDYSSLNMNGLITNGNIILLNQQSISAAINNSQNERNS